MVSNFSKITGLLKRYTMSDNELQYQNGNLKMSPDPNKELRNATLGIRIRDTLKQAAEQAATDDKRSLATIVEMALEEFLQGRGYLDKKNIPTAKGKKK